MAELLIKAVDAVHSDSEKDAACYKRGHVVDVRPDGWAWGREERLPRFVVIQIPGMTVAQARRLTGEHRDDTDRRMLGRREHRIVLEELPIAARNALETHGRCVVSRAAFAGKVHNRRTNQRGDV